MYTLGLIGSVLAVLAMIYFVPSVPITIEGIFIGFMYMFIIVLFPASILHVMNPGMMSRLKNFVAKNTGMLSETSNVPSVSFSGEEKGKFHYAARLLALTTGFISILFFAVLYVYYVPKMMKGED